MDWVKQAVFYQIFPDRFGRSKRLSQLNNLEPWDAPPTLTGFKGGDLFAVAERLDELGDMGVNALYLCPIFSSTANHRYHTHDYYQVDPLLGGQAAFRELVDEAHKRGMKVVLDAVFNHASRSFLPFAHALESGPASPYRDWFYFDSEALADGVGTKCFEPLRRVTQSPDQDQGQAQFGYRCWWNLPALPKMNFQTPQVQDYFLDVGRYWLEQGIDGWRLDVPLEIEDLTFWDRFRTMVKEVNPEAYIVAEIWEEAQKWVEDGGPFDAVMNYYLGKPILNFFLGNSLDAATIADNNYRDLKPITLQEFQKTIQQVLATYSHETFCRQMNVLTSHDTPRLLNLAGGDSVPGQLALAFLALLPGAPCYYYGEEIGLPGAHDPDCRRGYPEQLTTEQRRIKDFHGKVIAIRQKDQRLQTGKFRWYHNADSELLLFERFFDGGPAAICAINTTAASQTLPKDLPGKADFSLSASGSCEGSEGKLSPGEIRLWLT